MPIMYNTEVRQKQSKWKAKRWKTKFVWYVMSVRLYTTVMMIGATEVVRYVSLMIGGQIIPKYPHKGGCASHFFWYNWDMKTKTKSGYSVWVYTVFGWQRGVAATNGKQY